MVTWGDKTALTTQTTIDNATEEFLHGSGLGIDLSGGLSCHIQLEVDVDGGAGPTDDLIVAIYTSLDDTSEVWDDEPFFEQTITPADLDLDRHPLVVSGIYKFRIGCLSSGATNTYAVGGDFRVRTA